MYVINLLRKIKCLTIKLFRILNLFDQKNHFHFLALVQSKTEQFSFKTHKISEQQINPKVSSVASSCHYNRNSKMAKIGYRQMPAPPELSQQIPAPWAKARMQKAPGWGQFFGANPRGARERWLWMKLMPALA